MCSHEVARSSSSGVAVRKVGLPAAETLVSSSFSAPQWDVVVGYGVSSVLDYFVSGDNVPHMDLRSARTTPITFRQQAFPNGTVSEWTSAMMVSTAAYPNVAAIPAPIVPIHLEPVGARLVAVVQFSTDRFPSEANFSAACAGITADTLPAGYAIDATSAWSPTYALYSAEESPVYENECWLAVLSN